MKPEAPLWVGGVLLWTGFACMLAIFWPLLALAVFIVGIAVWAVGRREYVEPFERTGKAGKRDQNEVAAAETILDERKDK